MIDLDETRRIFAELAAAEAKAKSGEGRWPRFDLETLVRNAEPGRRGMELCERVETLQATVMKDSLAWHEQHKEVERLRTHLRAVLPLLREHGRKSYQMVCRACQQPDHHAAGCPVATAEEAVK